MHVDYDHAVAILLTWLLSLFCKAKAEEKKLLSQRTESQESDHDEEPRENQQLNKENKPKDKTERLDILNTQIEN